MHANPGCKYVIGVDAAALNDNAAISVIELHENHRRLVYCWATNKKDFDRRRKAGMVAEENYYVFVARKLLDLFYRSFPTERICIDQAGGGTAIIEALGDEKNLQEKEQRLLPLIDDSKEQYTDGLEGHHIIEVLKITGEYNSNANHGLKKDLQSKTLLFPKFDTVELARASVIDNEAHREFDTFEQCVMDIEECKNEMATIVVTQTSKLGAEHFDTPEVKLANDKKGRLRKDRFCSLLYANYYARNRFKEELTQVIPVPGDTARNIIKTKRDKNSGTGAYNGPGAAWMNKNQLSNNMGFYGIVKKR
jgi:hypothetical protein